MKKKCKANSSCIHIPLRKLNRILKRNLFVKPFSIKISKI